MPNGHAKMLATVAGTLHCATPLRSAMPCSALPYSFLLSHLHLPQPLRADHASPSAASAQNETKPIKNVSLHPKTKMRLGELKLELRRWALPDHKAPLGVQFALCVCVCWLVARLLVDCLGDMQGTGAGSGSGAGATPAHSLHGGKVTKSDNNNSSSSIFWLRLKRE